MFGQWLHQLAETVSSVVEPTISKQPENKSGFKFESKSRKESANNNENDKDIHLGGQVFVHSEPDRREVSENQCFICRQKCEKLEKCSSFRSFDVDRRWKELRENQLCRKCLGRHGKICRVDKTCGINGCVYKHHSLLHDEKKHSEQSQNNKVTRPVVVSINNVHNTFTRRVLLRIVPVEVHAGTRTISTFAYQDDGSDLTMASKNLIERLGIRGTPEPLCL